MGKKEPKTIKVKVIHGEQQLTDCMKNVIRKRRKHYQPEYLKK